MSRNNTFFGIILVFLFINLIYLTDSIPKSAHVYHRVRLAFISNQTAETATTSSNKNLKILASLSTTSTTTSPLISSSPNPEEEEGLKSLETLLSSLPLETPIPKNTLPVIHYPTALTALCQNTTWTPGLWLHCHSRCGANKTSICGGLNNALNRLQTCIRLAIDAGAGLILPSATTRDEKKLKEVGGGETINLGVFYDVEGLRERLGEVCKELGVRAVDDRSGVDEERVVELGWRSHRSKAFSKGRFKGVVEKGLKDHGFNSATLDIREDNPVIVNFADSYIGWDYKDSSELSTIRKELFKILTFNNKLLESSRRILMSPELKGGALIGVHLRGENDWPKGYGTKALQMKLYTQEIQRISKTEKGNGTKTIYVSCGSRSSIQLFRSKLQALNLGYEVHDKWSLLSSPANTLLLAQVEELGFDEKAIVEYAMLVGARYFMGIVSSTMSCLIAYARTVDGEEVDSLGSLASLVSVGEHGELNELGEQMIEGRMEGEVVKEGEDWFEKWIFGSSRRKGYLRVYRKAGVRGSEGTRLIVLTGRDIMRTFP